MGNKIQTWHRKSDTDFSVVFLEVKLLSLDSHHTWGLGVDCVNVFFESSLSFWIGQVKWESLSVLHNLQLLLINPHIVLFVHKVFAVSFRVKHTVVE